MMKPNMNEIGCRDAIDGPVVSTGGRSPSTLSTGLAAPSPPSAPKLGPLAPGQRWSIARKREVVLRLLRGESAEMLKEREADPADGQLGAAMQRVGELSMEVELLRARLERPGPLGRRRSR